MKSTGRGLFSAHRRETSVRICLKSAARLRSLSGPSSQAMDLYRSITLPVVIETYRTRYKPVCSPATKCLHVVVLPEPLSPVTRPISAHVDQMLEPRIQLG